MGKMVVLSSYKTDVLNVERGYFTLVPVNKQIVLYFRSQV